MGPQKFMHTAQAQSTMVTADTQHRRPAFLFESLGTHCNSSVQPEPVKRDYNTSFLTACYLSQETSRPVRTLVNAPMRKVRCQCHTSTPRTVHSDLHTALVHTLRHLNFSPTLLIPCASLLTVSRTLNFLFKVLFIFPSRYLFAIGLVPIFSFRRSLPPNLGCITKQPDS